MEVSDVVDRARDAMSVSRVFGEPIRQEELVLIPVARVRGGAGGGSGQMKEEAPASIGAGYGLVATPAGVYVVKGNRVAWRPAVDVNRVVMGGQIVAGLGLLLLGRVLRARGRAVERRERFRRRRFLARVLGRRRVA